MGDGTEGRWLVWRRQPARQCDLKIALDILPMIYETEISYPDGSGRPINLFVDNEHTMRQMARYAKKNYGITCDEDSLVAAIKRVNDELNFLQCCGEIYRKGRFGDEEQKPVARLYKATGTLEEARDKIIVLNNRRYKTPLAGARAEHSETLSKRLEDFVEAPA